VMDYYASNKQNGPWGGEKKSYRRKKVRITLSLSEIRKEKGRLNLHHKKTYFNCHFMWLAGKDVNILKRLHNRRGKCQDTKEGKVKPNLSVGGGGEKRRRSTVYQQRADRKKKRGIEAKQPSRKLSLLKKGGPFFKKGGKQRILPSNRNNAEEKSTN